MYPPLITRKLVEFIRNSTEILAEAKMDWRMLIVGPVEKDNNLILEDLNIKTSAENPLSVLGVM